MNGKIRENENGKMKLRTIKIIEDANIGNNEYPYFMPDTYNFKVICQKCGKTGKVDFDIPARETGFILQFGNIYDSNPYFEACRNEYHEYHGMQCDKDCSDYKKCHRGEVIVVSEYEYWLCLDCYRQFNEIYD